MFIAVSFAATAALLVSQSGVSSGQQDRRREGGEAKLPVIERIQHPSGGG